MDERISTSSWSSRRSEATACLRVAGSNTSESWRGCCPVHPDPTEVEDVAQETFIKAYRAAAFVPGRQRVLYVAVPDRHQHREELLVALGRRVPTTTEFDSRTRKGSRAASSCATFNTPESMLMSREIASTVDDTLMQLPEELRNAITAARDRRPELRGYCDDHELPIGTVVRGYSVRREAIAEKLRPLLDTTQGPKVVTMKEKLSR